MKGGMKKVNKNIFFICCPGCKGTCQWKQDNRSSYEKISQPKITHLKVPVQHVLDVHTTTNLQPNMV